MVAALLLVGAVGCLVVGFVAGALWQWAQTYDADAQVGEVE